MSVQNHHNYAWQENGKWVVRKGATPLTDDPAFIGGSMGDLSVIVRRVHNGMDLHGTTYSVIGKQALGSAPHGAGRQLSRTAAAGKTRKMWVCPERGCDWTVRAFANQMEQCPEHKKGKKIRTRDKSTAAVDWDATRKALIGQGITVLGAGADEAPAAYKDLQTVLNYHPNMEILHRLRPLGVVMAGEDVRDPYKD